MRSDLRHVRLLTMSYAMLAFTMLPSAMHPFAMMLPSAAATRNESSRNTEASPQLSAEARWLRRIRADRYIAADPAWTRMFTGAVRAGAAGDDGTWHTLGFETRRSGGVLWLRETAPTSGHGAYALRNSGRLLLQAPHADTDLGTGQIALRLFEETDAAALALNTVRRDIAPGADQAHSPAGPFVAMAIALVKASLVKAARVKQEEAMRVVQLHGFSSETAERLALSAETIVVGGDSSAHNARLAGCLREHGIPAQATGPNTRELAGQGNAVGAALQSLGKGRFVHLELGPGQRERMLRDPKARRELSQCL